MKLPSRYISKTLLPDEHCITDARFSWMYTVHAAAVLVLCSVIGYALSIGLWYYLRVYTQLPMWVGIGVGAWMFAWMLMKKWTTEIILTDQRLIYKRGFFSVKLEEVDIEQLASDNVEQSLLGRLFDYGTIQIRCIEAADIWLPAITKPYEFRNALEMQKHAYREKYMKVERLRHHGGGDKDQ